MVWGSAIEQGDGERLRKVTLLDDGALLSYAEVIERWRQDDGFCTFFSDLLCTASFAACFWETPPVTTSSAAQDFECVQIDSPALARLEAEPSAFARHFATAPEAEAIAFENLGGDAWLVAPAPRSAGDSFAHLLAFLRSASDAQKRAFWQSTGETLGRVISDRPLWLSTSGLGVAWLHIRLDTRPKYYVFEPYRRGA